jgi:hypothetical protein
MAIREKVGLEAEFLLINAKDEIIIPPSSWDRDGFPLLGEIRGEEGETVAETVTNFKAKEMGSLEKRRKGHTIRMCDLEMIKLALYKKANREVDWDEKNASLGAIKNIYGIDIEELSDQVVKGNKIQGIRISCGLHIHFSCGESIEYDHEVEQYEQVILPIGMGDTGILMAQHHEMDGEKEEIPFTPQQLLAKELLSPTLYLYRRKGYKKEKTLKLYASRLNKPAIEYIVKKLDDEFFDRFAPAKADRTKYRQKGFYELKPYGFEYRSLPANAATMEALPEITKRAFALLGEINER